MDVLNICRFASGVVVSLQAVPLMMMGDMTDVGRRSGTLFTVLSIGALVGPPISGAIAAATGDFKAVGFYAGKETSISVVIVGWLLRFRL
jgi:MCP family monocarboxylic acid transporter-like MFS transporter 10